MTRWVLAAIAVALLSLGISASYHYLSNRPPPPPERAFAPGNSPGTLGDYEAVSLAGLLADPQRYDGRKLRLEGYLTLRFEDAALHLDGVAYDAGLRRNAIWIEQPRWMTSRQAERLSRRYGEIAGVFDASEKGMYGFYSGTLKDVKGAAPLLTRTEFERIRLDESRDRLLGTVLSPWFLTFGGWMGLWLAWLVRRGGKAPTSHV